MNTCNEDGQSHRWSLSGLLMWLHWWRGGSPLLYWWMEGRRGWTDILRISMPTDPAKLCELLNLVNGSPQH